MGMRDTRDRSRWVAAFAVVAALVAALALSACGGDDSPSQAELDAARKEGQQQARQQAQIDQLKQDLKDQKKESNGSGGNSGNGNGGSSSGGSSSGGSSSGFSGTDCGQGVVAGPNTSCQFAINVAGDFNSSGQPSTVDTYSPTTGQTYTMHCVAGSPNICRGGNNASVAFP